MREWEGRTCKSRKMKERGRNKRQGKERTERNDIYGKEGEEIEGERRDWREGRVTENG